MKSEYKSAAMALWSLLAISAAHADLYCIGTTQDGSVVQVGSKANVEEAKNSKVTVRFFNPTTGLNTAQPLTFNLYGVERNGPYDIFEASRQISRSSYQEIQLSVSPKKVGILQFGESSMGRISWEGTTYSDLKCSKELPSDLTEYLPQ